MPKNWERTGYLIPDNINPEENICVCVPVPKDWGHIRAFMGQLTELSKWITWEKTGGTEAAQAARRWFDITECVQREIDCIMTNGCGCGGSGGIGNPTNQRYTEEGHLEVSYDGGLTWEDGDAFDPRFNSPIYSPIPGVDGADKRCIGANSVVTFLKAEKTASSGVLGGAGGLAALVASVAIAVASTGVGIVAAVIIAIMGGILNVIAGLGQATFDGSFVGTFWDDVLCIIYCNLENDGTFTEAGWQATIGAIKSLSPYPANEWTSYIVKTLGLAGATNASLMQNIGTASCDGCNCDPECADESWIVNGSLVAQGDGWIEIMAGPDTYGGRPGNFITYGAPSPFVVGTYCCVLCNIETTATFTGGGRRLCDGTIEPFGAGTGVPYLLVEWGVTNPTDTIKLTFLGAPTCP